MFRRFTTVCLALALIAMAMPVFAQEATLVEELGLNREMKEATAHTAEVNSAIYSMLDFEDTTEAEFATRGLIDAPEALEIVDANGKVVWSQKAYSFLDDYEKAPDTANPSLWENTRNNHAYGLFEVCEGIYQVRGYDMANLTVIKGDTGWIVYDTLMSVECSKAAMELVRKNLGDYPIKAVIISHSHIDHFGGIEGIISAEEVADPSLSIEEQLASGKVPIIVPEGFAEHAISENILAGKAMVRRASYMYGAYLEASATGTLAQGIGMGQSLGTVSYIAPTHEIRQTGETLVIDGIEMEFQMTNGSEAPAEMNTWLPQFKALWLAENCTGTLHNLYTLRGAEVRDGKVWTEYILESVALYGEEAELVFQSHNWPHWGNDVLVEYMMNTAAVYKFIHDQTLIYINQGYTSDEISNMIALPDELNKVWCTRQYYGTIAHNSKAVYQKYMGWYDANPVNLDPLQPAESAKKWVEYIGDVDEALRMAKADYDAGEYQWVAELTNAIVYADPDNEAARLLCADALEQMGYQAESGVWRNAYLSGAMELRHGVADSSEEGNKVSEGMLMNMTPEMLFDYMSTLLNSEELEDQKFSINLNLVDVDRQYVLIVKNGVLLVMKDTQLEDAEVSVTTTKMGLMMMIARSPEGMAQTLQITGDAGMLDLFVNNLTNFTLQDRIDFDIVEP